MNCLRWMLAVAALAVHLPAHAATTDPEVIIYRVSGVRDDGTLFIGGVATSFHCTNFSGATENVRIVVRREDSVIVANFSFPVPHLNTFTVSTHGTVLYSQTTLSTGVVAQGTAAIPVIDARARCELCASS